MSLARAVAIIPIFYVSTMMIFPAMVHQRSMLVHQRTMPNKQKRTLNKSPECLQPLTVAFIITIFFLEL
jgi:hypothetical protein